MPWDKCDNCGSEKLMKVLHKCEECGTIFWQCPDCGFIDKIIELKI